MAEPKLKDSVLLPISNLLYLRNWFLDRFIAKHPNEKVYLCTPAKTIITKESTPKLIGLAWLFSKRANVILTGQRLALNDGKKINLPISQIKEAKIQLFSGLASASVVVITSKDNITYQFGTNMTKSWLEQPIIKFEQVLPPPPSNKIYTILIRLGIAYFVVRLLIDLL